MSKIVSVKLDETLFDKLDQLAKAHGLSKSAVIKKGIEMVSSQTSSTLDKDFIKKIDHALRYKKPIPPQVQVNWNNILEELSTTAPKWETVEDAMNYARKRG
jgi:predicted DNA-binding protein